MWVVGTRGEDTMKILYYIHNLGIGGAETIVTNYLLALKACGHETALIVNDEIDSFLADRLSAQEIRVIPLRPGCRESIWGKLRRGVWRYTNYYSKRWEQIFQEEAPDVFHIHTAVNLLPAVSFSPNRIVYTFHGDVSRSIELHGQTNFQRIYELAQAGMSFFSLSRGMSEDLKQYFKTDKIVYIPNGVDLSRIRRLKYKKNEFLKEIGLPSDAFLLGQVGRFHPVKNQVRAVEIFAELVKKEPKAYFLFIGDGHEDYQKLVKDKVGALKLQNRVLFLGMRSDAVKIMSVLDALVLPSVSESFSLVLVEAQAQGLRAAASKAVPEDVICSNNCFRLDLQESNQAWADCLLGNYVVEKDRSIEMFSIERVVERMAQCYGRIADESNVSQWDMIYGQ